MLLLLSSCNSRRGETTELPTSNDTTSEVTTSDSIVSTTSSTSIVSSTTTVVSSSSTTTSSESSSSSSASSATTSSASATSSSSSSISQSSSQTSISTGDGPREGDWFDEHYYYNDIGFYAMGAPKNASSPIELKTTLSVDESSWSNNDLKYEDDLGNFRYIYKNACDDGETGHKTSAKFYENDEGGLKFTERGTGFGSPLFSHEGAKLEIRIGISQLNNNSEKPTKGKDTAYLFFFDKDDNYLGKYAIAEGSISSTTRELKIYYTENAKNVAYFEFRFNALPYKSSQTYNVGIDYCNFKSWERA